MRTATIENQDQLNFSYAVIGTFFYKFIVSIPTFFSIMITKEFIPLDINNPNASSALFWSITSVKFASVLLYTFVLSKISRKYLSRISENIIATLIMTLLSVCLAFLPGYQRIGITSTIIFTIIQFLEGICIASEIPFVSLDTVQHSSQKELTSAIFSVFISLSVLSLTFLSGMSFRSLSLIGALMGLFVFFIRIGLRNRITILKSIQAPNEDTINFRDEFAIVQKIFLAILPLILFQASYLVITGKWWLEAVQRLNYVCAPQAAITIRYSIISGLVIRLLLGIVGSKVNSTRIMKLTMTASIITPYILYQLSQLNYPILGLITAAIPAGLFQALLYKRIIDISEHKLNRSKMSDLWNITSGIVHPLAAALPSYLCYSLGGINYTIIYTALISILNLFVLLKPNQYPTLLKERFTS